MYSMLIFEFIFQGGFMVHWVCIALGGAIGAVARSIIQVLLEPLNQNFPTGTFVANAFGCFLAGILIPFWPTWPSWLKSLVMAGFLGALTTYSSFAVDIVTLASSHKMVVALGYLSLTIGLCLSLCFLGYYCGQKLIT